MNVKKGAGLLFPFSKLIKEAAPLEHFKRVVGQPFSLVDGVLNRRKMEGFDGSVEIKASREEEEENDLETESRAEVRTNACQLYFCSSQRDFHT